MGPKGKCHPWDPSSHMASPGSPVVEPENSQAVSLGQTLGPSIRAGLQAPCTQGHSVCLSVCLSLHHICRAQMACHRYLCPKCEAIDFVMCMFSSQPITILTTLFLGLLPKCHIGASLFALCEFLFPESLFFQPAADLNLGSQCCLHRTGCSIVIAHPGSLIRILCLTFISFQVTCYAVCSV